MTQLVKRPDEWENHPEEVPVTSASAQEFLNSWVPKQHQ
jgi:hypothetical protein